MSRRVREESKTGYYHVMQRGAGKQILFEDDTDYQRYVDKLLECKNEIGFILPAYCLMNNHVHLLIKTTQLRDLSKTMSRIGTSYAAYYNIRYEHVGNVFQGRFLSSPINDEQYLLECVKYIHNNPVKANFGRIDEYAWIREMKKHGLSNHQIELITGISRDLVRRI